MANDWFLSTLDGMMGGFDPSASSASYSAFLITIGVGLGSYNSGWVKLLVLCWAHYGLGGRLPGRSSNSEAFVARQAT